MTNGSGIGPWANVRFGSKADICAAKSHVRFTRESGHLQCSSRCPLWAKSGHRHAYSAASEATGKVTDIDLCQKNFEVAVLGYRSWQNVVREVLMFDFSYRIRFWAAIMTA